MKRREMIGEFRLGGQTRDPPGSPHLLGHIMLVLLWVGLERLDPLLLLLNLSVRGSAVFHAAADGTCLDLELLHGISHRSSLGCERRKAGRAEGAMGAEAVVASAAR